MGDMVGNFNGLHIGGKVLNLCRGIASMGKCSYTWKEQNQRKRCLEETWGTSDKFCIFHDFSLEKDVDLFKEKLEEQMESETEKHNFIGYYFPENWDFSWKEFKIDADFTGATFQGTANFAEATFQGTAYFWRTTFQDAYFWRTTFQDIAYFGGATFQDAKFFEATFQGTANFVGATFQNARFGIAIFQGDADFSYIKVKEFFEFNPKNVSGIIDIRKAKFFFSGVVTVDLESTKFHGANLQNVVFDGCIWPKCKGLFGSYTCIYEEIHMKDKDVNLSFKELETTYRNLKQNMQNHGDYSRAGEFYYREMEMKRKEPQSWGSRLWLSFYRLVGGYGESPLNTAIASGFIVSVFALVYGITGCLHYTVQNPCLSQQIKDSIYFSFVTFTTLGLGDIRPLNDFGKFLICCEAVIGAFLIALFVVVFARKMMR
jgi:hypothetical protein